LGQQFTDWLASFGGGKKTVVAIGEVQLIDKLGLPVLPPGEQALDYPGYVAMEKLLTEMQNRALFFSLWWKQLDDGSAARLLAVSGDNRYHLESLRRFKPHTLSEPEEKVVNLKNVNGPEALMTVYDMITYAFTFESPEKQIGYLNQLKEIDDEGPASHWLLGMTYGSMEQYDRAIPEYIKLEEILYNAIQFPMLRLVKRDEGFSGIRVPQSGWVHQPKVPGEKAKILEEFIVNNYIRTSRFDRFHRHEDALLKSTEIDPVIRTLFSTQLEALDLYNKPMARNSQILSETIELLLDGPRADRKKIGEAALKLMAGGLFRYRFYFPPMQAGLVRRRLTFREVFTSAARTVLQVLIVVHFGAFTGRIQRQAAAA
jgi:tetratricopeptide (TPR) repeat protein